MEQSTLIFFVNGVKVVEEEADPEWTLLYYLRYKLRLTGTKEGCSEGGCGACTVMMSAVERSTQRIKNKAINACLTPLCSVHLTSIVTTEGIGSLKQGLHPVQERIAKSHGSQCGFCTPGFVMSMYALLRNNPCPTEDDLEVAFQGNLCRCTGYRPILQGFQSFCKPSGCCRDQSGDGKGASTGCCRDSKQEPVQTMHDEADFKSYDPSQDPIFPPELFLMVTKEANKNTLAIRGQRVSWFGACDMDHLVRLKGEYPGSKVVAGNTELGVDQKFKQLRFPTLIHIPFRDPVLTEVSVEEEGVNFGASLTLTELQKHCSKLATEFGHQGLVFGSIAQILHWFGGQQVRNVATIAGNIATASPISDLVPIFMAAGASATLISSSRGSRSVPIDRQFFPGYRKTLIADDEILSNVFVPKTKPNEYFWAAKQSRRKDDDIAIVNAAIRVSTSSELTIIDATIVFGGMGPTAIVAQKTMSALLNKKLGRETIDVVLTALRSDLRLPPEAPGGMPEYRTVLATNLFFKFYIQYMQWTESSNLTDFDKSATRDCSRPEELEATQLFQIVKGNQPTHDLVGRPVVHAAGLKHATGEAIYADDLPLARGELWATFVLSNRAVGKILQIDPSEALKQPGVVAFFSAKDFEPGRNVFGVVTKDEPVFVHEYVECHGQAVGLIVAKSQAAADEAANLVKVHYDETFRKEPILTIADAISNGSYFGTVTVVERGGASSATTSTELAQLRGKIHIGGQEHFYMETQSCVSYPKEDDEIEVALASQSPTYIQASVSQSLGIPSHKITVKVRRLGGGFGGKETRTAQIAIATSLAAHKLGRPVRCVLNRVADMKLTGFRHPFLGSYHVAYDQNGRIHGVEVDMYCNAGCSLDLSQAVMNRAVLAVDSAYNIPSWTIKGYVCKTNLPSNTAFRGFGGPQASLIMEAIIDGVANAVGKSTAEIRQMHLYQDGDITPYDYTLKDCTVKECWEECYKFADFPKRQKAVEEFNALNKWKKRGICMLPTKHLIGFTEPFLNQAGALVMIYTDGSVLLNHGGTEMGQGLHTKMLQIASRVLEVPFDKIYFSESSTDKIPNTSSTAGSLAADLNGPAVMQACQILLERLKPYKESNPQGNWEDWVLAAYFDKVNLSAIGFHTLNVGFDIETKKGIPCSYMTYGVGCSEVEIDVLTGDHTVLQTDIVMDLGESLNPAIDIGQIEGAFVQGYGLFTMEELVFSPNGSLLTKGPGMYKIPSVRDIPKKFHVSLLRGTTNSAPRALYSSKAVGEPPLFLGGSVFFAIKEAIRACRSDRGHPLGFRLDSPATAERIVLACENIESSEMCLSKNSRAWSIRV